MPVRSKSAVAVLVILSAVFLIPLQQARSDTNPDIEQGVTLYRQENYDEAAVVLRKARKEDPSSSLAAYYLGITYKQLQDYRQAKTQLIDAVTITPRIKEALV